MIRSRRSCVSCRGRFQYRAGIVGVNVHLCYQIVDVLVFLLPSQSVDEVDVDIAAVDVLVEIEEVDLQQRLRAVERGSRSHTRDAVAGPVPQARDSHRENAGYGALAAPQIDVGGRIAKAAADLFAFDDLAGHAVRPAE